MDGELVSGEVLHPGLMLAWEEGDCPDVAISLMGAGGITASPGYPSYGGSWATPHYEETPYPGAMLYGYAGPPVGAVPGAYPYAPQMTREEELSFLKNQA